MNKLEQLKQKTKKIVKEINKLKDNNINNNEL